MNRLQLPIKIDYEKIAEGIVEMFTDEERTVARFGMLPAKKMELLEEQLHQKFEREFTWYRRDAETLLCETARDWPDKFQEFSPKRLVADIVHNVSLAMYPKLDLVV